MQKTKTCPKCGGTKIRHTDITAPPDPIVATRYVDRETGEAHHHSMHPAKFRVQCLDCGHEFPDLAHHDCPACDWAAADPAPIGRMDKTP